MPDQFLWGHSSRDCDISCLRGELPWKSCLQFLRKEKTFLVFGRELSVSGVFSVLPTRLWRYALYDVLVMQSTSYLTYLKSLWPCGFRQKDFFTSIRE